MDVIDRNSRFGVLTSPWAERYGLVDNHPISLVKEDPLVHSWLAPILPALPPRYYDKVPRKREWEIANTFGEIDSILVTEEIQRISYHGLTSWHLPPLNTVLSWDGCPPLLGGHRPGDGWRYHDLLKQYYQERIEVDEDSWLPFFRKDRWYNIQQLNQVDLIENEDGSKWYIRDWSVDDERIWQHVRFILEIANRILLAMIRDNNEWLETLLYGRIQLWYELFGNVNQRQKHKERKEDKRILLPFAHDMKISKKRKKVLPTVKPEPDPEKRIAFLNDLLQNLTWGFSPIRDVRGNTVVMSMNRQVFQVMCRLGVGTLVLLCGGTISVAERCILYTRLAITALHELMHAIYKNRLDVRNNVSAEMIVEFNDMTTRPNYRVREPFVNNEPIAELGRSFEAGVFGGTPRDRPSSSFRTSRKITSNVVLIKYPSKLGISGTSTLIDRRGRPEMSQTAPMTTYFLPAALLWRLQSKAFWDGNVDGKKGFLFPHLFTGVMQQEKVSRRYNYMPLVVDPDAAGGVTLSDTVTRWNEQVQLWTVRRPWYREALIAWKNTAWGFAMYRRAIEMYIGRFKVRDEVECGAMAWELQGLLPKVNVKALPGDDESLVPKHDAQEGGPQLWLLHCLGTLMLAALPMRKNDQPAVVVRSYHLVKRSAGVPARFTEQAKLVDTITQAGGISKRNVFFSRISDQGVLEDFNRIELVDHVSQMMMYVGKERGSYIPLGWFDSIYSLTIYMRGMLTCGVLNEGDWLPEFPFQIPPYEPDAFKRWDEDSGRWENVRPPQPPDSPSKVLHIANLSLSE